MIKLNNVNIANSHNINLFTVNPFNDNYYIDNHRSDEFNDKIIQYYRKNYNLQIFDYTHPLVKECKEKYKYYFDKLGLVTKWVPLFSDIVRLYILSKIPYSLYIDDDVVINFDLNTLTDKKYIQYLLCMVYNGNETKFFKNLLDNVIDRNYKILTKTYSMENICDWDIVQHFNLNTITNTHLCYYHYCNWKDNLNNFSKDMIITKNVSFNGNYQIYYNLPLSSNIKNNMPSEIFDFEFLYNYFSKLTKCTKLSNKTILIEKVNSYDVNF